MGSQDSSATVRGLVVQPLEFRTNVPGHSPIDTFQDRVVAPAASRSRQVVMPARAVRSSRERVLFGTVCTVVTKRPTQLILPVRSDCHTGMSRRQLFIAERFDGIELGGLSRVSGERPPRDEVQEKRKHGLATTHVQQYEESTCAREVGTTNQLVPEDSSLEHSEITCNSFNNNELWDIFRVLNATLVREGGSCQKPPTVKEPENPCLMFSSPQSSPAGPGPVRPADRP